MYKVVKIEEEMKTPVKKPMVQKKITSWLRKIYTEDEKINMQKERCKFYFKNCLNELIESKKYLKYWVSGMDKIFIEYFIKHYKEYILPENLTIKYINDDDDDFEFPIYVHFLGEKDYIWTLHIFNNERFKKAVYSNLFEWECESRDPEYTDMKKLFDVDLVWKYTEKKKEEVQEVQETLHFESFECPICLDNNIGDLVYGDCGHGICSSCEFKMQITLKDNKCPCCRKNFYNKGYTKEDIEDFINYCDFENIEKAIGDNLMFYLNEYMCDIHKVQYCLNDKEFITQLEVDDSWLFVFGE
jgi:hypothetical protein